MKKYFISITILLFFTTCDENSNLEKQMDEIFIEFQTDSQPGAAVAVIKDNEIIYEKGFGLANLETRQPISSQTNFRLASITKQFTALSILLLEHHRPNFAEAHLL